MFIREIISNLIATLLLLFATSVSAVPAIYNIVVDGTGSVSDEDFSIVKEQLIQFARLLHARSQLNIGERADMLSVNFFGGNGQYNGTIFVNCSDENKINALQYLLLKKKHPKFNKTAIYSAIIASTVETMQRDGELPGYYVKSIILVTDGEDNNSPKKMKTAVRKAFPNSKLPYLFVIGVGTNKTDEFEEIADKVLTIDSFGKLGAALAMATQLLR